MIDDYYVISCFYYNLDLRENDVGLHNFLKRKNLFPLERRLKENLGALVFFHWEEQSSMM